MGKVIDTTKIEDSQYLLSQTPPNFIEKNYYLKEIRTREFDYIKRQACNSLAVE